MGAQCEAFEACEVGNTYDAAAGEKPEILISRTSKSRKRINGARNMNQMQHTGIMKIRKF
jgi:hypothetical protein